MQGTQWMPSSYLRDILGLSLVDYIKRIRHTNIYATQATGETRTSSLCDHRDR